jgi:hypothetical protein
MRLSLNRMRLPNGSMTSTHLASSKPSPVRPVPFFGFQLAVVPVPAAAAAAAAACDAAW